MAEQEVLLDEEDLQKTEQNSEKVLCHTLQSSLATAVEPSSSYCLFPIVCIQVLVFPLVDKCVLCSGGCRK